MRRRLLLLLIAPAVAGCTLDPSGAYLGGFGDPVRGAALNAPWLFGDMSRYAGNPAGAARAVAQVEFLTDALFNDPFWSPRIQGTVPIQMRMGRDELRAALGIAPDAGTQAVIAGMRGAADALAQGSTPRAEAALSAPLFTAGGRETLDRLGSLPRLPRLAEAAGGVAAEFDRLDRRR